MIRHSRVGFLVSSDPIRHIFVLIFGCWLRNLISVLLIYVAYFWNAFLVTYASTFTPDGISGLMCVIHTSLYLMVLSCSNVVFVFSFCIFDAYVSCCTKKPLLFFFIFISVNTFGRYSLGSD